MIYIYTIFLKLALPCLALPCLALQVFYNLNKLNLVISILKNIMLIYGIFNIYLIILYKFNILINNQKFKENNLNHGRYRK